MAGLQRSTISFRRQGSSGLVWEDRFLSGDLNQMKQKEEEAGVETRELTRSKSVGSTATMERSRSNGGRGYRTGKVSPAIDPPSPKVSACGFCCAFKKPANTRRPKSS
ncbi:PREDICTED: uncharacterized protein At1g15400 [Nelumbo nucifera]|uniref:MAPK kinase substrate protein At1g80180-like n=2 Tax=Nelumbo nucifera TaxID=4432 RepID=A0A822Y4B1_NELNU|nr:PREDICTED: uncharacterized protein At1g15400 [Nelumbo nucifera]DAD27112.1 TPA_asm: hypothetical protein HUJ06_028580 [Nelumbo nucifera]